AAWLFLSRGGREEVFVWQADRWALLSQGPGRVRGVSRWSEGRSLAWLEVERRSDEPLFEVLMGDRRGGVPRVTRAFQGGCVARVNTAVFAAFPSGEVVGFGQDCSGSAAPAVEMWGNGAEMGVFEALPVLPRDAMTAVREGERAAFRASAMATDGPGRI